MTSPAKNIAAADKKNKRDRRHGEDARRRNADRM
jgi:hypothetical protein